MSDGHAVTFGEITTAITGPIRDFREAAYAPIELLNNEPTPDD